jgi:hypothetical protein
MDAIGRYFREFLAAIRGSELEDREILKVVSWDIKDEADEPNDGERK